MIKLWKFFWDCGRQGNLEGVFAATEEQINNVTGKEIYFGEVLGKHSEIFGILDKENVTFLTDDQHFIEKCKEYKIVPSGYNPLEWINEDVQE